MSTTIDPEGSGAAALGITTGRKFDVVVRPELAPAFLGSARVAPLNATPDGHKEMTIASHGGGRRFEATMATTYSLYTEPQKPRWLVGTVLAWRRPIIVMIFYVFAIVEMAVFATDNDIEIPLFIGAALIVGFINVVRAMAQGNLLERVFQRGFWARNFITAVVFGVVFLFAGATYRLVTSRTPPTPDLRLSLVFVLSLAPLLLDVFKKLSNNGCKIALFRSFSRSTAKFTVKESAPTMAGFGSLAIVNDGNVWPAPNVELFGIESLQMVPVAEQRFFTHDTWKPGVAQIIRDAKLCVFDTTEFSDAVAWELSQAASIHDERHLIFISEATSQDARWSTLADSLRFKSKLPGSFSSPIRYRSNWIARARFRLAITRCMRAIASE